MVNTEKSLELRHFRCVLAVAHSLHFARAAAELGISPPALTKQVQETEQLLGTRLFQRSKRAVALTAAGELFVPEAARALEQLAQAQEAARRAGRGELGRLEIGYVASAAYSGVLQGQFARFRASHPGIRISAREYAMEALPALLDQGRVDLAFVRPPLHYPDGIDSVVLLRDRFVLAVQADSPLAQPDAARPDVAQPVAGAASLHRAGTGMGNIGSEPARRLCGAGGVAPRQPGGRADGSVAGRGLRHRAPLRDGPRATAWRGLPRTGGAADQFGNRGGLPPPRAGARRARLHRAIARGGPA